MDRCVNCGIATTRCNTIGRRILDDDMILTVIRQWREPQRVHRSDHVCQACWDLATRVHVGEPRQLGHTNICLRCGRSLATRVRHHLHTHSTRESRIYNVIQEWIIPQTVGESSYICHACWVAADRAAVHMVSGPSTSSSQAHPHEEIQPDAQDLPAEPLIEEVENIQPEPTIILPDYMRVTGSERRCFVVGCQRVERYRVPLSTRKMLLNEQTCYIPENNRLCDQHIVIESWDYINYLRNNCVQTFTAKHIQDMMFLKETQVPSTVLNFEAIHIMEDHVVHTWLGLNKVQFNELFNEVPQLSQRIPKAALALAVYLMKLRSGDSNERLALLIKVCRRTLEKWLHQVREISFKYLMVTQRPY